MWDACCRLPRVAGEEDGGRKEPEEARGEGRWNCPRSSIKFNEEAAFY